jgi:hypothetical protein
MTRTNGNGDGATAVHIALQGKGGVGKSLKCTPVCEQPGELRSDTARKNLGTQSAIKIPRGIWFKVRVNSNIVSNNCARLLSCSDAELQ